MRTREKFLRRYLNGKVFSEQKRRQKRGKESKKDTSRRDQRGITSLLRRNGLRDLGAVLALARNLCGSSRDTPTLRGVLVAACCRGGDGSGDAPEWVGPISGDLLSSGAAAEAE